MSVPTACITRCELQALISRTSELAGRAHGELSGLFAQLGRAAAAVEGYLAEQPTEARPSARSDVARVLANPLGWRAAWAENTISAQTPEGEIRIGVSRQLVLSPHRQRQPCVCTGRFRLTLGGRRLPPLGDVSALRVALHHYLSGFSAVPAFINGFVQDMLDSCGGDCRAVYVETPAT